MAWTYDCDYEIQSYRLTPTAKRKDVRLAYQNVIDSELQWEHDRFFETYLNGSSDADYSNVTAYVVGDRVNYQNKIYECVLASTGNLPSDTTYWILVTNDFRGAVERIKYNCLTIVLEYLLNKWFDTTFVQPGGGNSDIYIENNDRTSVSFEVSEFSYVDGVFQPSEVPELSPLAEDYVGDTAVFSADANFTVNYPISVIASTTSDEYYQMVGLVNKYKTMGTTVEYVSY